MLGDPSPKAPPTGKVTLTAKERTVGFGPPMQRRFSPSKASRLERLGLNMSMNSFDEGKAMLDALAEKPLIEEALQDPVSGLMWRSTSSSVTTRD